MDPARFYGSYKHVNPIPGEGLLSDDELASDSDSEYVPPRQFQRHRRSLLIPETDSESCDDESNPPSATQKIVKSKKNKPTKIKWELKNLEAFDVNNFKFTGVTQLPEFIEKLETPSDFFLFLFSEDLLQNITHQSNLKSVQDNVIKPANISKQEIEQFIGMVIFMSIVKLPASRHYWNKTIGQTQIYETMACNRFETIKKNLHFNDNDNFIPFGNPGHDKLFKVRPLLNGIRQQLLLVPKEEYLAVDEQIIPTKVRHDLKQYNPAKPHKWGYKNQVLSGVSGFSYEFDIFAGEQSNTRPEGAPDLGVSGNVVTRLTETVPRHVNHKIFFDNWYNSPKQIYLTKIGFLPLGTVRLNRVPNIDMPLERELKKQERGFMIEKVATIDGVCVSVVTWFDNKPVHMLSTYVGCYPTTTKRRYFRKKKQYKNINCPQAIEVYNQHMGGVDLLDSMLGLLEFT
ncbi:unnamed protein product [Parnassius mnemosyne]|uniref:PiggyBac transposable element-derived protein domain-containing protein n=1 Tax=Parnassius mnemosyne TaxID=213953 RepID=A0AAV1LYJ4_9NEOP